MEEVAGRRELSFSGSKKGLTFGREGREKIVRKEEINMEKKKS